MTSRPFGWCLFGASDIARSCVGPAIQAQPDATVVGVLSSDLARAQKAAIPFGARAHDDIAAALDDPAVDAVYVSSVNALHHAQASAAIKAGKHVLCEKPLALTAVEAADLVTSAKRAGVTFATNHHMRNSVPHQKMREAVRAGDIGEPVSVIVQHAVQLPRAAQRWRTVDPSAGAGVVLDITVHDADCLRFVLDRDPETVTAQTSSGRMTSDGIDETVSGTARFGGNVLAGFVETFVSGHAPTRLAVLGTEGALLGEGIQSMQPVGTLSRIHGTHHEEVVLGEREDLYVVGVRRFQAAIRGEGQPAATGADGVWSVAFAEAVLQSANNGHSSHVEVPPGIY
jgi:1,5-anhydro-D-fructose reductase (1,5-anhydro-D-mannitol-forming)